MIDEEDEGSEDLRHKLGEAFESIVSGPIGEEMRLAEAKAAVDGGMAVDYFFPARFEDPAVQAIVDRIPSGWGRWLSIDEGWFPIVVELNVAIAALHPEYEVHQVKEKFGGLRYYCSYDGTDDVAQLIRAAEAKAAKTCEVCGAAAVLKVSRGGWYKTICDACDTEHRYHPVPTEDPE